MLKTSTLKTIFSQTAINSNALFPAGKIKSYEKSKHLHLEKLIKHYQTESEDSFAVVNKYKTLLHDADTHFHKCKDILEKYKYEYRTLCNPRDLSNYSDYRLQRNDTEFIKEFLANIYRNKLDLKSYVYCYSHYPSEILKACLKFCDIQFILYAKYNGFQITEDYFEYNLQNEIPKIIFSDDLTDAEKLLQELHSGLVQTLDKSESEIETQFCFLKENLLTCEEKTFVKYAACAAALKRFNDYIEKNNIPVKIFIEGSVVICERVDFIKLKSKI